MKHCSVCKLQKPLPDFPNDRSKRDGKGSTCFPCARARNRRNYYGKRQEILKAATKERQRQRRGELYEFGVRRRCRRCGEWKEWEQFGDEPRASDGKRSECKACASAYNKARWPKVRERANARRGERRRANAEAEAARVKAWHAANADRVRAYKRRSRVKRRREEPWLYRFRVHQYRERKRAAPGSCTLEQAIARVEFYGGRCWLCGAVADALDHVKPLTKGGSNWPANLRPCCHSCNSRKSNAWPVPARLLGRRVSQDTAAC